MAKKFDRRAAEMEIERLQAHVQLHDAILGLGLMETLRALVEEYSLPNVEEFVRRLAAELPKGQP